MKIVFLWACAGGPHSWGDYSLETGIGGSEAMMILYAREFAKRGHEVECYCPNDMPGIYQNVSWYNWERQKISADVVVSLRTPKPLMNCDARIKALLANDQKCDELPPAVNDGACNLVITISRHQQERYQALYPDLPVSWLCSSAGVEFSAYKHTPKQRGLCLYMSTPERGLEYLITLWPIIHRECPWSLLKITSGFQLYGWSEEDAKKHSRHIYDRITKLDGVEYVGPIPRPQLQALQSQAQIMLYPSTYDEMCCIAALEASAAEMAILTTNRAALKERVVPGLTGYLVDGHPEEIAYQQDFVAYAVSMLQDEDKTAAMGRAGRITAAEHDYSVLAAQWEDGWKKF